MTGLRCRGRRAALGLLAGAMALLGGCWECQSDPESCPTTEERICERLAECEVIEGAAYTDCLRWLMGTEAPLDLVRCEGCLARTECDMLEDCDARACR